jgi:hypothetical protein
LNEFIVGIVRMGEALAANTRRNDEYHRQVAEREERRERERAIQQVEAARIRAFDQVATRWDRNQLLRMYLGAVQAKLKQDPGASVDSQVLQWIAWAEAYVERSDPLSGGINVPEDPGAPQPSWQSNSPSWPRA